jgi:hypothetical protein
MASLPAEDTATRDAGAADEEESEEELQRQNNAAKEQSARGSRGSTC